MSRIRRNSLIPRYSYPMVARNLVTSTATADSPFVNTTVEYTFLRGAVEVCTLQNLSDWEINNLPQGVTSKQTFKVFSNTPLYTSIEGTDRLSDSIYLPDVFFALNGVSPPVSIGGWYNVVKSSYRMVGIIPHSESLITKDYNTLSNENIEQYPDVTALNSLITSKSDLLSSSGWLPTWLSENT